MSRNENVQMRDTNENLCTFIIHFTEYLPLISIDFLSPLFKNLPNRMGVPRKYTFIENDLHFYCFG